MEFKRFKKEHFSSYQKWFEDPWLQAALGPMDHAWLEHILHDQSGAQYAIFEAEKMVAVLGTVWASKQHTYHTITDLAIRPDLRRKGWGRKVLRTLIHCLNVPKADGWVTYVESSNSKAIDFMKQCDWELFDKGSMYAFRWNNGDFGT